MKGEYSEEELEVLRSIENGQWKTVAGVENEKNRYQEYAIATLRKDRRVNIRISERDLKELQRRAVEEGIPYQTLISSLLHKYTNGRLVDMNALDPLLKQVSEE